MGTYELLRTYAKFRSFIFSDIKICDFCVSDHPGISFLLRNTIIKVFKHVCKHGCFFDPERAVSVFRLVFTDLLIGFTLSGFKWVQMNDRYSFIDKLSINVL